MQAQAFKKSKQNLKGEYNKLKAQTDNKLQTTEAQCGYEGMGQGHVI